MASSAKLCERFDTYIRCFLLKITRQKLAFLLIVLAISCLVYVLNPVPIPYIFKTRGTPCRLHELDPWDKTLSQYLKTPKQIQCAQKYSLLFVDEKGYLQYNKSAISLYSLTSLKCEYHVINRVAGDKEIQIDAGVAFEPPTFVNSRVFRVVCNSDSLEKAYDFVHINVAWNQSESRERSIGYETDSQLSILFFGLDSASRSHALRKLPKSYKYLTETLGAYDFRGYMKVGLNSFPNQIPLLTGEEHYKYPMENLLRTHLDDMPFIWKEEAMEHYMALHSEDRPDISTMNFLKSGFKNTPVDYYYRPFSLAMDQIEPVIIEPLGKSTWHCYGNKDHFLLQIDYLKRFITKYTKRLKFSFLWNNQIGHEDFISLGRGDQPLHEFLQWLKANGHLEQSILIVGSDHGFRLGGASTTYVGRIENNMPFLMIYIPEKLKSKYPWLHKNLQYNTNRLITPFDVHETMMDVISAKFKVTSSKSVRKSRTSRSLFSKIPETRTCTDAGVPAQYCTCYDSNTISTSHPVVTNLGQFAVQHLNSLLQKYKKVCRELILKNITEAKVMYIAEGDEDNSHIDRNPSFFKRLLGNTETDDSGRYVLMIYTKPNDALIEIMIDYEKHAADGTEDKMTVIGEPVRVNKYGNQSHCINDSTLRQYCLCFDINVSDL